MKRSNSVLQLQLAISLILLGIPAFCNALAVVESRAITPTVQSERVQEAEFEPEPIGLYERPHRSEAAYHEQHHEQHHEQRGQERSRYGKSKGAGNLSDDRAAHLTLKQLEVLQQEISELRGL